MDSYYFRKNIFMIDCSFIICTHDPNQDRIDSSIETIVDLRIPRYEIIVVGGKRINKSNHNINFIEFDEAIKGWLTKKKNLAAQQSKYETLCIMHDYFAFDKTWYFEWCKFNDKNPNWDIGCNRMELINGARDWADWISYDHPNIPKSRGIPYNDLDHTKNQYIPGHYFLVKRKFFLKNPLNEKLIQAQEEDVEWSLRVRDKAKIVLNTNSIVRHLKYHRHLQYWRKRSGD